MAMAERFLVFACVSQAGLNLAVLPQPPTPDHRSAPRYSVLGSASDDPPALAFKVLRLQGAPLCSAMPSVGHEDERL